MIKSKKIRKIILLLFICFFFLSVLLIYYMKGYIFDNPGACKICHIMKDHYNSWEKSTHNKVTTCNDCHISPVDNKYIEGTKTGFRHTISFLSNTYKKPLSITEEKYNIVKKNCYRCHTYLAYERGFYEIHHKNQSERCENCHYGMYNTKPCKECHAKSSHNRSIK